ncbi:PT domain-containing protein [Micromonospora narathiwatensis]|uniref:PT repeat-containing protein n=1 Tax=Micromonospora narathiwatensis TaxID=299146 RepID=A0A1A8ZJ87_9ACTN|nr:PT domain-containing protein [Micromonospora narathiwatensis]SBT43908.1 PT repeat-containing protein [Micromonospora narathiwatensis]
MSKTGRSRLLAAVLTAAASALLTACGGDSTPTTAATGAEGDNPFAAYQNCLRDNGITLPSGGPGRSPGDRPSGFPTTRPSGFPTARPSGFPSGFPTDRPSGGEGRRFPGMGRPADVDEATWQKAQEACASVRPTGGPGGWGGPGGSAAPGDGRGTAYRTCLSGRGVDLDHLDPSDAKTKEALLACAAVSPAPTN